jgi:hypothetical protein
VGGGGGLGYLGLPLENNCSQTERRERGPLNPAVIDAIL